jgi:hypothetical protein
MHPSEFQGFEKVDHSCLNHVKPGVAQPIDLLAKHPRLILLNRFSIILVNFTSRVRKQ